MSAAPDPLSLEDPGTGAAAPETARERRARRALRHVASGVTVLTVASGDVPHGTTVSAIMPISRVPLVLGVCLRPSSAFSVLAGQTRCFSVNVLADGQEVVAARFADRARPHGHDQFAGLPWSRDAVTGAPLLRGCLAYLGCRVVDRHRIGDHDLLVAEVTAGAVASGTPLLSFAGRLRADRLARPDGRATDLEGACSLD